MPPSPARASSRYRPATTRPSIGSCGFVTLREVFTFREATGLPLGKEQPPVSESDLYYRESHLVTGVRDAHLAALGRAHDGTELGHGRAHAKHAARHVEERGGTTARDGSLRAATATAAGRRRRGAWHLAGRRSARGRARRRRTRRR